ncbi:MAG: Gldg family protein, partial [Weeksellaceae bacterium]|nr:Gldg family protein [Weeksellaceae bacterium]
MRILNRNTTLIILLLAGIVLASEWFYKRFDLTQDKRYTLTETTHKILKEIDFPLKINILLGGELSGDYRTLKNEISFILDEFREINPKINFQFIDPTQDFNYQELQEKGLNPAPIKTDKGVLNIYPYAQMLYDGKEIWMETLVNDPTLAFQDLALASTEKLEYLFMDGVRKITQIGRKNVGFLVHHDELSQLYMNGFGRALADNYNVDVYIQPIQDSTYTLKESDLESLQHFDALVVAKPTLPFSDSDKLVL